MFIRTALGRILEVLVSIVMISIWGVVEGSVWLVNTLSFTPKLEDRFILEPIRDTWMSVNQLRTQLINTHYKGRATFRTISAEELARRLEDFAERGVIEKRNNITLHMVHRYETGEIIVEYKQVGLELPQRFIIATAQSYS